MYKYQILFKCFYEIYLLVASKNYLFNSTLLRAKFYSETSNGSMCSSQNVTMCACE